MTVTHPAFEQEAKYVEEAHALLERGFADREADFKQYSASSRATAQAMRRALAILRESRGHGQLVFGRIDREGQPTYIGRRRVYDAERNLRVIGWHAPAASVFYEATPEDTLGVELKRVFVERDQALEKIIDEIVAESAASIASGTEPAWGDSLLQELERSRDGAMREVVATIQAEQYAIIRAPGDRPLVVQGGPGTGKSVVGLHRAAFLTFNSPELRAAGILVVAPSLAFLSYIAGVLPSLDATSVDQIDLDSLYGGDAVAGHLDGDIAERVKGGAAMAEVLRRALDQRIGQNVADLEFRLGIDRITLPASVVQSLLNEALSRDLPRNEARDVFRNLLSRRAADAHALEQRENRRAVRVNEATIRRLSSFTNVVDRLWPTFTPEELLRSLYGTQSWLVAAADGVLPVDERSSLYREPKQSIADEPWTRADLPCLDELSFLLNGPSITYGHIIIDEAQDLSPMFARALARRCPSGSMTVLGDLGQATGPWVRTSWGELTGHLSSRDAEERTLSIGYRVPRDVLELAAAQLVVAGADVPVPQSVRTGFGHPVIVEAQNLATTGVERAASHAEAGLKVGVIVPDADVDNVMAAAGEQAGDGETGDLSKSITILSAVASKGLEFDVVVLVDPASIAGQSVHGARLLYVAMTRCTKSLEILHDGRLPDGFPMRSSRPNSESMPPEPVNQPLVRESTADDLMEQFNRLTEGDQDLVRSIVARLLSTSKDDE